MKHKRLAKRIGGLAAAVVVLALFAVVVAHLRHAPVAVMQPRGTVARQERQLILIAVGLSLVVVLPVFALLAGISWRYRAGNAKARYAPEWHSSNVLESIWWLVPGLLILILSVITWNSSHQLDPYRPLSSKTQPLTIQVVALDWKWLFIYPAQQVATVNYLKLPVGTPVNFELTADAPMNSLWIPQLGGQMYAMPGMSTQLHLEADAAGDYHGSSANISGKGFAGMTFIAHAVPASDFSIWAASMQHAPQLDMPAYTALSRPSKDNPPATFSMPAPHLYDTIVMKYMMPQGQSLPSDMATGAATGTMPGMNMNIGTQ